MGEAASTKPATTLPEARPAARRTIVVVEDDAATARAIGRLLECAGFEPRVYSNASAFLRSGTVDSAACLIFDIHLPDQSGIDLKHSVTNAGGRKPVIFITGLDDPSLRAQAARLGAVGFLQKPFAGQRLLEAIASAIQTGD